MAGGIAAGLTTPLDVVKTRIMLSQGHHRRDSLNYRGTWKTLRRLYHEEGTMVLFSGMIPRTLWIGLGGAIFFGVYEESRKLLAKARLSYTHPRNKPA